MSLLVEMKRVFRKITPIEMASRELADAELALMEAQTGREYADSMVRYHEARIDRLRSMLHMQQSQQERDSVRRPTVLEVA